MHEEIFDELQSLHFDNLALSPTRASWVKKWSKARIILFIGPTMWVLSTKDGKTHLWACTMVFRNVQ
jgi:hypothetical protein